MLNQPQPPDFPSLRRAVGAFGSMSGRGIAADAVKRKELFISRGFTEIGAGCWLAIDYGELF